MVFEPGDLPDKMLQFLTERHLATFTTQCSDGSPQVTPVGVTYDPEAQLARVITWSASYKARSVAERPGQSIALCQVDGGRWATIYGTASVTDDAERVREGVDRYTERYRPPKERSDRVVIEIAVERIVGRA